MQKYIIIITLLFISTSNSYAIEGHNGIKFDMTQKQIESLGFICNPSDKPKKFDISTCRHMDMTGVAFGVPTGNYVVTIGSDERVADIRADLSGISKTQDYFALLTNISGFFPKNDEPENYNSGTGTIIRNWRANNNAGIGVFRSPGVKGILKDTLWVNFRSPDFMAERDKSRNQ